jgi:ParB-like chromosome segregation protein Spo0J
MEIVYKKLDDLIPYANNPRFNDEAVEYVANSIKEFGFKVPIVIDKNNEIVAGHTRYKASIELGLTEVPCIIADDLSEEQIKAFRLVDNKVSEASEWNFELLDEELENIDIDLSDYGFENIDVSFDESDLEDDRQKTKVQVAIVYDSYEEFEKVKEEYEALANQTNGNMSIKMI